MCSAPGVFEPIDVIPCFLYQALKWKDQHVFCHGDSAHLQKSWVDQERSGIRWMKLLVFGLSLWAAFQVASSEKPLGFPVWPSGAPKGPYIPTVCSPVHHSNHSNSAQSSSPSQQSATTPAVYCPVRHFALLSTTPIYPHIFNHLHSSQTCKSSAFQFKSPGGLSSKSYAGTQRQSDKQAAQVLNMRHFREDWDAFGHVIFAYLEAILLSPWNCTDLYENIEQMLFNNLCGYYFVGMNIMVLQKEFGDDWTAHFLPLVTVQNTFSDVGHLVARCLFFPAQVPFLLPKQRELAIEWHFGGVKSPYRGMPKYKDMIIGTAKLDSICSPWLPSMFPALTQKSFQQHSIKFEALPEDANSKAVPASSIFREF